MADGLHPSTAGRLALSRGWLVWALMVLLCLPGLGLLVASGASLDDAAWGFPGFEAFLALSYGTVGALITARRPRHPVGWIFLAAGFVTVLQLIVGAYARYGTTRPGSLPGVELVAWVADWIWVVSVVLSIGYAILLFPDGQLPSRRWRLVAWLLLLGSALLVGVLATVPGRLTNFPQVDNPFGVPGLAGLRGPLFGLAAFAFITGVMGAAASIVVRFRRSTGDVRLQLKWYAFAAALAGAAILPGFYAGKAGQILFIAAGAFIPVAAGIAILRYRLYEIDGIINRTIVVGALSAILAGVYTASITLSQRAFVALTGERSDAAIVLTTLIVVSLVTPVKTRLQTVVDRRFANPEPGEAAASGTATDPLEQVRELGELRDMGYVTSAEFEAKKAELLGRV